MRLGCRSVHLFDAREAKVRHLGNVVAVQQHVARGQVAMDDARVVQVRHAARNLHAPAAQFAVRPDVLLLQHVVERAVVAKLHDQRQLGARVAKGVERDHIGVRREAVHGSHLFAKRRDGHRVVVGQHFDGNGARVAPEAFVHSGKSAAALRTRRSQKNRLQRYQFLSNGQLIHCDFLYQRRNFGVCKRNNTTIRRKKHNRDFFSFLFWILQLLSNVPVGMANPPAVPVPAPY